MDLGREYVIVGIVIGIATGVAIGLAVASQKQSSPAPSATFVPAKTYSNLEEWEIVRDPDTGRVKGVRVKRTAQQG